MIELLSNRKVPTQNNEWVLLDPCIWCRGKSKLLLQSCHVKASCCLFEGKACFRHQIVEFQAFSNSSHFWWCFFSQKGRIFNPEWETDWSDIESVRTKTSPEVSAFLTNSLPTNLCTIFDCNSYLLWKKCSLSFLHNMTVVCSMYFSSPFFAEHENCLQPILS